MKGVCWNCPSEFLNLFLINAVEWGELSGRVLPCADTGFVMVHSAPKNLVPLQWLLQTESLKATGENTGSSWRLARKAPRDTLLLLALPTYYSLVERRGVCWEFTRKMLFNLCIYIDNKFVEKHGLNLQQVFRSVTTACWEPGALSTRRTWNSWSGSKRGLQK